MNASNELQVEEYFRKRIEKRSVRLKFRALIPESFRLFVPHEKSELSAERTIQSTWSVLLAIASKISILATRCYVNSNFLNLCKATDGIYGKFYRAVIGFRILKSLSDVSEKGQV